MINKITIFLVATSLIVVTNTQAQGNETGSKFFSTGKTAEKVDSVRFEGFNWGNRALRIALTFDIGFVKTKLNSEAMALKVIKHSVTLINLTDPKPIKQDTSILNNLNLNFDYNCFGYCFTDAKYWIDNPMPFLNDEFEQTDKNNAEIGIFLSFSHYTEDGTKYLNPIHAVKIDGFDSVSYKPGYRRLKEKIPFLGAADDYNFNQILFYRRKKQL